MLRKSVKNFIACSVAGLATATAVTTPALALWPIQDDQEAVRVVVNGKNVVIDDDAEVAIVTDVPQPKRWLGIQLKEVEGDLATFLGNDGIFVISVFPDSPAKEAGIEAGDVILSANDTALTELPQLLEVMAKLDDDDKTIVALNILRKGEKTTVEVTPKERPELKEVVNVEGTRILEDGDAAATIHREILGRLGSQELNILRLGTPAMLGADQDMNITIQREEDGEQMEVTVTRKDGGPAKFMVKKGGEVEEFTTEEIEDLPKEIRVLVQPMIEKGRYTFEVDGANEALGQVIAIIGEQGNEMNKVLASEEITARIEAIAKEASEQAQEASEQAKALTEQFRKQHAKAATDHLRKAVEGVRVAAGAKSGEIEELRGLVKKLQAEIKELRKQLSDK